MTETEKEFVKRTMRKKSTTSTDNIKKDEHFTMLIDDFGVPGMKQERSHTFGFGISITDRSEEFGEIARRNRPCYKDEIKFSDKDILNWFRKRRVIRRLSSLDPETFSAYVDKRKDDHPTYWEGKNRNEAYRRVLKESVKYALKETDKDDFMVLIDYHTALKDGGRDAVYDAVTEVAKESGEKEKKIIDYEEVNSKKSDMMQAHDFVSGSANLNAWSGNDKWVKQLDMKVKRLMKE